MTGVRIIFNIHLIYNYSVSKYIRIVIYDTKYSVQ